MNVVDVGIRNILIYRWSVVASNVKITDTKEYLKWSSEKPYCFCKPEYMMNIVDEDYFVIKIKAMVAKVRITEYLNC